MQMFRKNSSMHIPNVNIVRRKNACIYLKKKTLQEEDVRKILRKMCVMSKNI